MGDAELVTRLRQAGVGRGDLVGLAVAPDGTVAVTVDEPAGWVGSAGELAVAAAGLARLRAVRPPLRQAV